MESPLPEKNSPNVLDYQSPDTRRQMRRSIRRRAILRVLPTLLFSGLVIGMAAYLLLPNLNITREPATRIKCAANMRTIGQGILIYANANGGQYPARLESLLLTVDIVPNSFVCPTSGGKPAPGKTRAEWAANLSRPGCCSYIYIGNGLTTMATAEQVVLYEPGSNHGGDGGNVLFGDGHVGWYSAAGLAKLMATMPSPAAPPDGTAARGQPGPARE
jgi:prepilin-type processing-associated H-X9-DG protein